MGSLSHLSFFTSTVTIHINAEETNAMILNGYSMTKNYSLTSDLHAVQIRPAPGREGALAGLAQNAPAVRTCDT